MKTSTLMAIGLVLVPAMVFANVESDSATSSTGMMQGTKHNPEMMKGMKHNPEMMQQMMSHMQSDPKMKTMMNNMGYNPEEMLKMMETDTNNQ